MAVSIIGPKFYAWDSDTGKPLAFGKVYTYQSGTNTPKATFTTEGGETENANPVILNGAGYADIFLSGSYKIVVKDADDVEVWTSDPVSDPSQLQQEWVRQRNITQVNANTFTVDGELTGEYVEGVAVRVKQDSGFVVGTVDSASYADGKTTVTLGLSEGDAITSSAVYAERALVSFQSFPKYVVGRPVSYAENLDDLIAITDGDVVYLKGRTTAGDGGEGNFQWNGSDLSGTLVTATATTDSVDDATDTINDADHPFSDGDGVTVSATVNGLTQNALYWVVNSASGTYQLSTGYNGSPVDLTGTTNFTVYRLLDPLQGIYACDDRTGAGGAWVRNGIKAYYPALFGALGGGADDTAPIVSMTKFAGVGARICIPEDYILSVPVKAKDYQEWLFGGWLKLADGGQSIYTILDCNSTKRVTLINPLIDGDALNNTDTGGSGQQSALRGYSVDGLTVLGGHIKNAMHNCVQGSVNDMYFANTKFELAGEHLVYLSSGINGPALPVQSGAVFNSCHFINPFRDTANHSEGHFLQARGLTDITITGKTIMHKDINESASFVALFTNCKDVELSGITCSGATSALIYADKYCETIETNHSNYYKTTTAAFETSRNFSDDPIVFNDCFLDRPTLQPSQGRHAFNDCHFLMDSDFRSSAEIECNNCEFELFSGYSPSIILQARDEKFTLTKCRVKVGAETPLIGVGTLSGGSGHFDIDGLVFEDWPNAAYAVRIEAGSADYQSIKGVELPATVTGSMAIWIRDNAGIVRLAELNCVGTTPTISATGVTAVQYGNITSST